MSDVNRILVTGAAGFIGFHLIRVLLDESYEVIGIDNLSDTYDLQLKRDRLALLLQKDKFYFYGSDCTDEGELFGVFAEYMPDAVVHLAAYAGPIVSMRDPYGYIQANICGFVNVLECCRLLKISHLLYASSSAVYGSNGSHPYSEQDHAEYPATIFAATKKSNELLAHSYSQLYGIPTTGLRFSTVYGPWGRPDMLIYSYTKDLFENLEIEIPANGQKKRDFAFVEDVVNAVVRLIPMVPDSNPNWDGRAGELNASSAPYRIYNIGDSHPVSIEELVTALENATGKLAVKTYSPTGLEEEQRVHTDTSSLKEATGYKAKTQLVEGLETFVDWYKNYHKIVD